MTGTFAPELPEAGEGKGLSDSRIRGSLITLRDGLNGLLNSSNKVTKESLETGVGAIKWYTPKIIATEESRTNTSYGTLTTADEITGLVVPEAALLLVYFRARVKSSITEEGHVGLFLGSNLILQEGGSSASAVEEKTGTGEAFGVIKTNGQTIDRIPGTASDATTGQVVGRPLAIFLAAGTYALSVRYKAGSGSVTAKDRKLWAAVLG